MELLKRLFVRCILPPAIALSVCIGVIYLFPDISDELYFVIMIAIFTATQILLVRD